MLTEEFDVAVCRGIPLRLKRLAWYIEFMTPNLTEEQRQALHDANDAGPVSVVDSQTSTTYVLLRADLYEQMQTLLDFDPRETYPFVEQVMAEDDAGDPTLDSYQHLAPGQKSA